MDTELAQQKSLLRWKKKAIAYVRWDRDNSWFPLGFGVILVMQKREYNPAGVIYFIGETQIQHWNNIWFS